MSDHGIPLGEYSANHIPVHDEIERNIWPFNLPEEEREEFAFRLLLSLPLGKITNVQDRLYPYLHKDFSSHLPQELCVIIFSFLDARTLLSCGLVSKSWRRIAMEPLLWKLLYHRKGWTVNDTTVAEWEKLAQELFQAKHMLQKGVDLKTGGPATPTTVEDARHFEEEVNARYPHVTADEGGILKYCARADMSPAQRARMTTSDIRLDYKYLYQLHEELDRNWKIGKCRMFEFGLDGPEEERHMEGIYTVQFDQDWIVTGSRDRRIIIWDMKTLRYHSKLVGHEGSVLCLQFDAKEGIIISGSSDSTIVIWDMFTGAQKATLRGHQESVLNLHFDDKYIVSCSKDCTIRVWDRRSENYECIRVLQGHSAAVNAVQFKDNIIVSGSGDRVIKVWNLETGEVIRDIFAHSRGIACIEFDGQYIVSGSSDKSIKMFDLNGSELRAFRGHDSLVRTIQLSSAMRRIVSGSYDETIRIWDLDSTREGSALQLGNHHQAKIFRLQFDSRRIMSSSSVAGIVVYDFGVDVDCTFF
ncbi:WD40 repeat-like protein [Saitoella complicata NRRL Y-17804]|uniref:F-box domain-containing protein n=1 Tax=Saitoella complicata (strain BCRC 22490 / CBS 7301 / JCM 7358 / NBRC 10748 / NRRL Y-17804) TaxID=698492 RepID=A0A0E9NGM2_SAICN|nr:WD40 repeat-like protein [Saitoella complicata NRRL Y-17804]ODQ53308.1 WD40 repeat-like protein [Saitoella complicata NRRL Y-17804]GAO48846.1 hypothetical protein G7K_3012-t1 [Saitoella complicata NRRL Y-17804]